ncbi:MAG: HEAT repeat domain-containing protein [Pseudomonadales bacterium]|nr:HEAT repeat domain-containing protein [Pseudomonadales bacterium]
MTNRFNLKLENNTGSSISVVERYRKVVMQDDFDESLALVHYRGGEEEFQIGAVYLRSDDPIDRAVGADILAQLGWQDRAYLKESVSLLISALEDTNEFVVCSVCCALGRRSDASATAHIVKLAGSLSAQIRYGVVSALLGQESQDVIDVMILLSRDSDGDVRNWAMFGLGSQIEVDTNEIRDALFVGASDDDSEVRGEALVGLAVRGDQRVVDLLLSEWANFDDVGVLSLEAAEGAANPRLYSKLLYLQGALVFSGNVQFESQLQCAIDACQPKVEQVNTTDR